MCIYIYIYVTEFAKRGLIHASNFLTLRMCNSGSVGPTAKRIWWQSYFIIVLIGLKILA